MNGKSAEAANWTVRNQEFITSKVGLEIKDGIPKSMQDKLDDHLEDYRSMIYEDWCGFLSTIKVKDERESAAAQIKKINSARESFLSDSNKSASI